MTTAKCWPFRRMPAKARSVDIGYLMLSTLATLLVVSGAHAQPTPDCVDDCPCTGESCVDPGDNGVPQSDSGYTANPSDSSSGTHKNPLNQNASWNLAVKGNAQGNAGLLNDIAATIQVDVAGRAFPLVDAATGNVLSIIKTLDNLPISQSQATSKVPARVANSDPVGGDGEFVIDEMDLKLPGKGIPLIFERHYRSGIDYQTPLGFGWNHTFNQRLVLTPQTSGVPAIPDVLLIDDKLEQIRFTFTGLSNGTQIYREAEPGNYRLTNDLSSSDAGSWVLDKGDNLRYIFDSKTGLLQTIKDLVGDEIKVEWDSANIVPSEGQAHKVLDVVDTTGRKVYFNYKTLYWNDPNWIHLWYWQSPDGNSANSPTASITASDGWSVNPDLNKSVDADLSIGPNSIEYLQCLSLANSCDSATPLVSFYVEPMAAISSSVLPQGPFASILQLNAVQYALEFDLVGAKDSKGFGPTYKYYKPASPTYGSFSTYQKQFDDFWPSRSANALLAYYKKTLSNHTASSWEEVNWLPPLVSLQSPMWQFQAQFDPIISECQNLLNYQRWTWGKGFEVNSAAGMFWPVDPGPSLAEYAAQFPIASYEFSQKRANTLYKTCQSEAVKQVKNLASKVPKTYQYGVPPELFHNVIEVDDANGNIVIQNTYGADTTQPSFDRVVTQIRAGDPGATTTYRYLDQGRAVVVGNQSTGKYFAPVTICPIDAGGNWLPAKTQGNVAFNADQAPALEVVTQGPLGRTATTSYDAAGRALRTVDGLGLTTNYNYSDLGVTGVLRPSQERTCSQYDSRGEPTLVSDIPASGASGGVITIKAQYDDAEQLVSATQSDGIALVWSKSIVRDSLERVLGVGEEVDSNTVRWTCFQYPDVLQGKANKSVLSSVSAAPHPAGGPSPPPSPVEPRLSLCSLLGVATDTVSAPPSEPIQIVRPDGTQIQFLDWTSTGPGKVVWDAKGTSPVVRYYGYDSYGRVNKTGLQDFSTQQSIPGSEIDWETDLEGLVSVVHNPDSSNPSNTVDTTYTYDKSRNLTTIISPLLTQTYTSDVFGHVTSLIQTPKYDVGSSGAIRSLCATYDAYGELTEITTAEGDTIGLTYDADGNNTQIAMGPPIVGIRLLPKTCGSQVTLNGIGTAPEIVKQLHYNSIGQLDQINADGGQLEFSYDGLGRRIDTYVLDHVETQKAPSPHAPQLTFNVGVHYSNGYLGGRIIWSVAADHSYVNGKLPAYLTTGVHAATEYAYDLVGRPLQVKQWQFTENPAPVANPNPFEITTLAYDDSRNAVQITTPEQTVYAMQKDGADRVVEAVLAQGAPEQISTAYSYSVGGTVVTSVTSPAPTVGGTLTQINTASPLGVVVQQTNQGLTVLHRQLDAYGRVVADQSATDVQRTYTYDAFSQLIAVQEQQAPGSMFTAATYSWNKDGNLLTTMDGAGHSTSRTYDVVGRLNTLTNGLGTTTYRYVSGTGSPSQISGPSASMTYAYDLAGRVTGVAISDASGRDASGNRTYQYSPLGLVASATISTPGKPSDSVHFLYDSLGQKVAETDDQSGITVSTAFSPRQVSVSILSSNLATMMGSVSIERIRDALGRSSVLKANGLQVAQWTYKGGGISNIAYSSGANLSFGYDAIGRVISESLVRGTGAGIASMSRSFGPDQIPHQSTLNVGSSPVETNYFMTDDAGRVTAEESINPGLSSPPQAMGNNDVSARLDSNAARYVLDGAANWISRSGPSPLSTVVDSANRYTSLNGLVVQNVIGGGIQSYEDQQYTWDGLNELTSAAVGHNSSQRRYDALGRLSSVSTGPPSSTTHFIWDGNIPLGEISLGTPGQLSLAVGFDGQDVAAIVNNSAALTFLHHGPDESVFAATDSVGNLSEAYSYSAFGSPHVWSPSGTSMPSGATISPFLFQGAPRDAPRNLYTMGLRNYDPTLGRFLSPDPVGQLGGLNLFAFGDGRPLIESDPAGTSGRPSQDKSSCAQRAGGFCIDNLNHTEIPTRTARAPSRDDFLPDLQDSYSWLHVGHGPFEDAYQQSTAGFTDDSLSSSQRIVLRGLNVAIAPLAIADQVVTGILNIPYSVLSSGENVGQQYARASVTNNYDLKSDRYGEAILGSTAAVINGIAAAEAVVNAPSVIRGVLPAKGPAGLPDSALVARGGNAANQSAARINGAIGASRTPGIFGFSVQCNGGTCLSELGQFIRNTQLGVTTVGEIRAIGGDVIATPGVGFHATVTGVTGESVSPLFQIVTNPNPMVGP